MSTRGLLALALLLGACAAPPAGQDAPRVPDSQKLRGVTFDASRDPGVEALRPIAALGVKHIMLTPFAFQPAPDAPGFRVGYANRYFTESDAGIRRLAEEARALDVAVVLKPHLWTGRGSWTADIGMTSEADWQAWEAAYHAWILHYARLSEDIDAPLFVVGAELAKAVQVRPEFWRALIADVRQVYGGALTYAGNWHGDYEHVAFWDALDYVGVQAYFPLSHTDGPHDVAGFVAAWQPHLRALEAVAARTGKPVLFTEVGYRSVGYAAREPWRWPERGEAAAPDTLLQTQLYEAFFEAVWPQPWFAGAVFWKFYPAHERLRPLDFTPQGKMAERVLARGFGP